MKLPTDENDFLMSRHPVFLFSFRKSTLGYLCLDNFAALEGKEG